MKTIHKVRNRLLLCILFALACVRGFFYSVSNAQENASSRQGLLLKLAHLNRNNSRLGHYALEATGAFPYVRIITLSSCSVRVPMELTSNSPAAGISLTGLLKSAFSHTILPEPSQIEVTAYAESCGGCGGCSSCGSCGGCSSCSGCAGCSSCGSCSSCFSCSSCSSCCG
jgi:hypothetical protein